MGTTKQTEEKENEKNNQRNNGLQLFGIIQ